MPDLVTVPAEVVGAVFLLLFIAIAVVVARRRWLAHGHWAMLLAIRESGRWRMGMARPASDRVEWFSMRSVRLSPTHVWSRQEFVLGAPEPASPSISALTNPVQLKCTFGGKPFEVAVSRFDYTALRSWSESAPPGSGNRERV